MREPCSGLSLRPTERRQRTGRSAGAEQGPGHRRRSDRAYNFKIGKTPVTARLRVFKASNAVKRLEGEAAMFSLSLPLKVILPPVAGHAN